ncbi:HNH endonuclease [Pedobacter sp. KBW01]|uniref:HNH endonuclease n=1 Tax=Pedobacter sp. KBW01 TaxID=2153364 RepID=UPI000F5B5437|nr:hypothetical protein [Pedobacter sp. KBW01]
MNQPNVNGTPSKKPFCKNCGSTFKAVKFDHNKEHLELPLLTKEVQETIRTNRNNKVKKFREWIDGRRRTETSPLLEEYNSKYNEYLKTPEWKVKRDKVLKRDNYICQGCLENKATQVHHITYQNIYNEPLFDLVSVCDACHHNIHFPIQD